MKYILFSAPRTVLNPITGEPAGKLAQDKFMLELTCLQEFGASKQGIEKIEFTLAVREAIRTQAFDAAARGYFAFEDEHAQELKRTLEKFSANPVAYEALLPHMKAVRDQLDEPPFEYAKLAASALESTNGQPAQT